MHGILFKQLKEYVAAEHGDEAWAAAMAEAGIEPKLYLPVTDYPDDEALRLVDGVVSVTGVDRDELLESFGEALAPELLDTFAAHVGDDWDVMDLLARPDTEVFTVLAGDGGLTATRETDDCVLVEYASDLELCELATGVLGGIGEAFGESLDVSEGACMHDGAEACAFTVERS